jgi:hypothetical protein
MAVLATQAVSALRFGEAYGDQIASYAAHHAATCFVHACVTIAAYSRAFNLAIVEMS